MNRFALAMALGALILPAAASETVASDPALEARARVLDGELRCMVCQSQSLADSDAPLARDLRRLVRERLQAGDSDEQIKAFLVERYGKGVLMSPPFDGETWLLWLGPGLLLLAGCAGALVFLRRGRRNGGGA